MKVLTILGARPQFIKASTLSREFSSMGAKEIIVHTGQHFDHNMSQVFFDEMEIPRPDYNLEIAGLNHGAMTGRMMEKIETILLSEKPDAVLVYGDTNSTLAGALAAVKLHFPVAHVEAGLRSFNMQMPEEINRILTDRISHWLFCPTTTAVSNLKREGYENLSSKMVLSGDVMYDAVLYYKERAKQNATIIKTEKLTDTPFVLATLHRAENTDDPVRLREICAALNEIGSQIKVFLPLHPRTRAVIQSNKIKLSATVIDPVGYFDMLSLLENCRLALTDSGGLQKEAYFFNKFCITLRDQTEWVELVEAGVNFLTGASKESILRSFHSHINKPFPAQNQQLYGQGNAAKIIATSIISQ